MENQNETSEAGVLTISAADIIRTVNHLKYFLMSIVIISISISLMLIGFRPGVNDPVTFFVELVSIKNKEYPNGAAFSPNDLLSADILETLNKKYGIADYRKLKEALSVDYGSQIVEGISRKYLDQLAQKNLTQADVAKINNNFLQEVSGASEKGLRINVDHKTLGVSEETAKEIAIDLPKYWSELSIKKYKIFEDKFLSSVDVPSQLPKFNDATNIVIAYKIINQIRHGVDRLLNDNRLVSLKTTSGKSVADISSAMDRYLSVFFMPVFAYYYKKDNTIAEFVVLDMKLKIAELDAQISGIDSILDALNQNRRQGAAQSNSFDSHNPQETLQLGESGINNIVELAERASLSSYLKETLEKKRLLVFEKSLQQKELDRITKFTSSESVISDQFVYTSNVMLSEINSDYTQLLVKSREKLESDQLLLYVPVGDAVSPGLISKTTVMQLIGVFGAALALNIFLIVINLRR